MAFIKTAWLLTLWAEILLPVLTTKQAVDNLRFVSSDGKFTYYQNRSGDLLISTNYKVEKSLELKENTVFQITSSPARKWLVASADQDYQSYYSPVKLLDLYKISFGKAPARRIGRGISPRLHLNDEWASWFNPRQRKISFANLDKPGLGFEIPVANRKNPYFVPEVVMLDINRVVFTDLNGQGLPGLMLFNINSKKTALLQKFPSPNLKIEICQKKGFLYLAHYGLDALEQASVIRRLDQTLDYTNSKLVYRSALNDLGHLVCHLDDDFVYFIKNTAKPGGKIHYEAARVNLGDNKVSVISNLLFVSELIEMDGVLLIPHHGEYRVLLGENNTAQFDLLRKSGKKASP